MWQAWALAYMSGHTQEDHQTGSFGDLSALWAVWSHGPWDLSALSAEANLSRGPNALAFGLQKDYLSALWAP